MQPNSKPLASNEAHPNFKLNQGPRFGVESAENGTYRAALYCNITGARLRLSDKRRSYGEAFVEAIELAGLPKEAKA